MPAPVLNAAQLMQIRQDALLIDLASAPGGVDFGAAEARGIHAIHALALPGKTAPETAGEIVAQSVRELLEGGAQNG